MSFTAPCLQIKSQTGHTAYYFKVNVLVTFISMNTKQDALSISAKCVIVL